MADRFDDLFHALSDRTRRSMLVMLATGRKRVTELAANFPMSLPAVSKHIKVLEAAGLVVRDVVGRDHFIRANPGALDEVSSQVALLHGLWNDTLEQLDETLMKEETMSEMVARASRVINATPEKVFDAWLDAELMSQFMCPIPGGSAKATSDGRVGGAFTVEMIAPDGQSIPHHGEYTVVDRPKRLEFTWNSPYVEGSKVTITFAPSGAGTEVSLSHELLGSEESVKNHTGGWVSILELLEQATA